MIPVRFERISRRRKKRIKKEFNTDCLEEGDEIVDTRDIRVVQTSAYVAIYVTRDRRLRKA